MATSDKGGKGRRQAGGGGARGPARSRAAAKKAPAPRRAPAREREPAPELSPVPELAVAVEAAPIALSVPEPAFAARVPPPATERPRPSTARAIFLDVENTSRPEHLAHVIDHLAVDRRDTQTEIVAVANWKVVSHEAARLLARLGAHLVHSAPSTGVRDWSDLRLAVAAGIWLASARPGDLIEIVSDDRAFDAVGDVAASLGIAFHRLSYRRLVKEDVAEIAPSAPAPAPAAAEARGRRRRRRGGRGRTGGGAPRAEARERGPVPARAPRGPASEPAPARARPPAGARPPAPPPAPPAGGEAHTAPHDEIVAVVREMVEASPDRKVGLDLLANTLKARGFRRPPGSPRLMTRLRRIREIAVSPTGNITLVGQPGVLAAAPSPGEAAPWPEEPPEVSAASPAGALDGSGEEDGEGPAPPAAAGAARGRRRRRRRRPRSARGPGGTPSASIA